jgi:hypothetical protein
MTVGKAIELITHALAQIFRGIHWAIGMTTLPADATPVEERSFVLMWLGLTVGVIIFCAAFLYLLLS